MAELTIDDPSTKDALRQIHRQGVVRGVELRQLLGSSKTDFQKAVKKLAELKLITASESLGSEDSALRAYFSIPTVAAAYVKRALE